MTNSPVIVTTTDVNTQGTRKAHQPYAKQDRQALIERMVEQRIRTKSTWEQVARANHVSLRTVERWRKSDEWRQIESKWRRIMREETRTLIAELTGQAVDVLRDLMLDPTIPAFTRMHCAKALLEFGGIADEMEEFTVDHNAEFLDFLKHLDQSGSIAARVRDLEPLASGLLPPELQELVAERPETTPPREPALRAPDTHVRNA
jgi:hypothetical protein